MDKGATSTTTKRISTKLLGDAGKHYALSRFSLTGIYAAKMPDHWEGYDLAVETGGGLVRVSVKTRIESVGWRACPHVMLKPFPTFAIDGLNSLPSHLLLPVAA